MLVKLIEGWQKIWGAPAGWVPEVDGKIGGLPAKLVETDAGYMWESAWEPSPEELDLLNRGGSVHLRVGAYQHPVVQLFVEKLVEDSDG